jgi:hypothetical protein
MDEEVQLSAPPALWGHTQRVFKSMKDGAELDDEGRLIYKGYITHLFRNCNVPVPTYGPVLDILKRIGCITQVKRGGGGAMSEWQILDDLELDAFMAMLGKDMAKSSARPNSKFPAIDQQLDDIRNNIGGIDIKQAFADQQTQLNKLREEVNKLNEVRAS